MTTAKISPTLITAPYYLPPPDGARAYKDINDRTDHNYIRHNYTAFNCDDDVIQEYYPESEELYKKLTSAAYLIIPVFNVHIDQTPAAARARVFRHLPESEARELVKHRFQILNLWRPIENPALDTPLGFIDSRTVDEKIDSSSVTLKFPSFLEGLGRPMR
ncbi:hypothetical protein EV421DRAFT_1924905 [Armillaria borealis]|uniref:Uncharacterized protein n=1 Tax=Armillaria borealis TaxID=47425 RepID=A0AA39IWY9_9AGAR|nr:hypothetical protein EV421DRAFT_1924905 [Armillaria borealis]